MNKIKEFEFRENIYYSIIPKHKIGCELGVCRGFNSIHLFHSTKPECLHLVDLWGKKPEADKAPVLEYIPNDYESEVKKIFEDEIKNKKVKTHKMDTIAFLRLLKDDYLDWVYLDSSHNYEHVTAEIRISLEKVKQGGIIMGHDFHCGDTQRSGVIRAVLEYIQDQKMRMIAISSEKWPTWVCEVL